MNYTGFCVFSFGNLVFNSFFIFCGNFITIMATFALPISSFRAFFLKINFYWLPKFNNVRSITLSYSQIVNFLFMFWWILNQFVSTVNYINLYCYIKYIFVHFVENSYICLFPPYCWCYFYTFVLFWYQNVSCFPFLSFTLIFYWNIFTNRHTSVNFYYRCQRYFIITIGYFICGIH